MELFLRKDCTVDTCLSYFNGFSWGCTLILALLFVLFSLDITVALVFSTISAFAVSSITLLAGNLLARKIAQRKSSSVQKRLFFEQLLTLCVYLGLIFIGFIFYRVPFILQLTLYVFAIIIALLGLYKFIVSFFRMPFALSNVIVMACTILFSIFMWRYYATETSSYTGTYANLLRHSLYIHDTMIYGTQASMIKTYLAPFSTFGLYNFHPIPMYWLAEFFYACLASFTKINMIDAMTLFFYVSAVPLFAKQFLVLTYQILISNSEGEEHYSQLSLIIPILFITFALSPLVDYVYTLHIGVPMSAYVQPTMMISLIFMLSFASTVFYILSSNIVSLTALKKACLILLLPILFFIIAASKPSNILIILPIMAYLFFRFKCYKNKYFILSGTIIGFIAFFTHLYFIPPFYRPPFYNHKPIAPFSYFLRYHIDLFKYIPFAYSYTFAYLVLRLLGTKVFTKAAWRNNQLIDLEVFLVTAFVCLSYMFLINVPPSAYYFFIPFKYLSVILAARIVYLSFMGYFQFKPVRYRKSVHQL